MSKSFNNVSKKNYNLRVPSFGFLISLICILWSIFQLWIASDFPFYLSEKTNLNLVFNSQEARQIHLAFGLSLGLLAYPVINKINPKNKTLIDQTLENFQKIYSDSCRIYIRPSGTEPLIRVLVEAKNQKKVNSLANEITNKLFLEINKIMN